MSEYNNIAEWNIKEDYVKNVMDNQENNINYRIDIIKGILTKTNENNFYEDAFFMIIEDWNNSSYCILPISEEEYENLKQNSNTAKYEKSIQQNEYNQLQKISTFSDYTICIKYLTDYKKQIQKDYMQAYELLDSEYKQKRFKTIENYKEYIDQMDNIVLDKYQVNINEGYTEYICIDKNENYYIFKATNPLEYTLILDTYTITSDTFKQAYNKAEIVEKAQMNIDKFVKMLNARDYINIYENLFTDGYKQNNFPSLEEFKNFASEKFFKYNTINFMEFGNQGEILTYRIELLDKTGKNGGSVIVDIVMQLEDDYNFKLSFDKNVLELAPEQ